MMQLSWVKIRQTISLLLLLLSAILNSPRVSFGQVSEVKGVSSNQTEETKPGETEPAKVDPNAARKEAEEKKAREAARKKGDLTFDDLKFDIEKDAKFENAMLTNDVKSLDKRSISLRGYILPTSVFQQKGIKQFVLVRDNQECCFGPGALIYDCVIVEMEDHKTIDFTTRPVKVKGKFEIDTESYKYPDGKNFAIFKLKATEAK